MIFSKENVIRLLSEMIIDNGLTKDNARAYTMAKAWMDVKMETGKVQFIHTPNLKEELQELKGNKKIPKQKLDQLIGILDE